MPRVQKKVIACATVIEEMLPLPPGVKHEVLDFGLHTNPDGLKQALQDAIDRSAEEAETIILGYGLCAQAVAGLRANGCTLVVPKVDDCIAIFLGSRARQREVASKEPGSYYLTKGWIKVGDTPFKQYEDMVKRYGPDRAARVMRAMLNHYTRLVLINTGVDELEQSRDYSRRTARQFGLRFEEIPGSKELIEKMVDGPWEDEFVVVPPGGTIGLEEFLTG